MSLNQSFISDFQNIHTDLKGPKVKYKLHCKPIITSVREERMA